MTFLLSTIYPSALAGVIISLPSPTFHCMFSWLPLLLCMSCLEGTKIKRSILIINSADSGILNRSSHALFCFFGNLRETWTRHFNPRDALFLLLNIRQACVEPLLYPPLIKCSIKTLPHNWCCLRITARLSPGKEKLLLRAGILHLWRASLWKLNTGRILKNSSIIS